MYVHKCIYFLSLCRVHGIDNLRVIDASVLPTPLSCNPNSAIVGMATRGATMILKDYKKSLK